MKDEYGLSPRIKVRLREDAMGNVTITPVSKRIQKRLTRLFGVNDIFIQEPAHIEEYRDYLPHTAFFNRYKRWNSEAVFFMDSWTFRHMMGNQSD